MVAKKKITKSPKISETPSISMEESIKKEEHVPVVTQVVEVVEEETPSHESSIESESNAPSTLEDTPVEDQPTAEPSVVEKTEELPEEPSDNNNDEKRKELVDELFQKSSPAKPAEVMPEITAHKTNKTKPVILWAITMIVACLVVGGVLFFMSGKTGSFASIVAIPTPTSTPTPNFTPTPTPQELKRDKLSIQVLNGGGVAGAATKMKKLLEDKGYTVTDTANAPSYTYEKTDILVKSLYKAYIPLLEKDLGDIYTIGSSAATLKESSSYDVQVIVGKE